MTLHYDCAKKEREGGEGGKKGGRGEKVKEEREGRKIGNDRKTGNPDERNTQLYSGSFQLSRENEERIS